MTNSQKILLDLLKKSLFNAYIDIPRDANWQEVYEEANFQSVISIAFDGTAGIDDIPIDVYKKLKNHTVAVMLNNDNVLKAQNNLVKLLEHKKIAYAILKGVSVARYYPKPEHRTLGDIDFLVSKEDFVITKELLMQNGYKLMEEEKNHFHCAFKKDGVIVELHFEMSDFPSTPLCEELREELHKATRNIESIECMGERFNSLTTLFQACSLLLHTERHMSKDGIGFRQLLDFGFFIKENPRFLETEENVNFLKKFGLYKLAIICFDLFKKYFCDEKIDNIASDKLFEMALVKGNFGYKCNVDQTLSNRILASRKGANKFFVVRWFRYFKLRSNITWELAKKHTWVSNFAFVYLPVRYLARLVLGKKKFLDINEVLNSSKSEDELYSYFGMFEKE